MPVDLRSPDARRRFANGSTTAGSCSRGPLGGRHAVGEGVEQRVLVLLGRGRGGPPDPGAVECPEDLEPVPAGIRPPIAERRRVDRGQATADRGVRSADVEDGLRRQPEGRQARRQRLRRRPLPVEPQRLDALDPLADTGQLDRRGRQRSGQLDDEDAGAGRRHRAAPTGLGRRPSGRPSGAAPGQSCRSSSADGTRGRSEVSCGQHAAPHPPVRRAARRPLLAIALVVVAGATWAALAPGLTLPIGRTAAAAPAVLAGLDVGPGRQPVRIAGRPVGQPDPDVTPTPPRRRSGRHAHAHADAAARHDRGDDGRPCRRRCSACGRPTGSRASPRR